MALDEVAPEPDVAKQLTDTVARLAVLEKRLAVLEDEKALRELLARYGYYADAPLDDEYFALFTEDCVMDVSSGKAEDPYEIIRWEGLAQMKEFLAVRSAGHGAGFVGRSQHVQGNNLTITVHEDDTASAAGYSFILHQVDQQVNLVSASMNEWAFRRIDGQWRIHLRRRRMLGAPDTADVLTATER